MRARVVLVWLALSCAAAPAAGQPMPAAAYVGRPIAAVTLRIEGTPTSDPSLVELLQTKPGAALSMADVRETVSHFISLGRFEDVSIDAESLPDDRVNLRYDLTPLHTVSRVAFTGSIELPERVLRDRMVERFGATPPVGRAGDVARTLEQLYADYGYLQASVAPEPTIQHHPDLTVLNFRITPGPRARIGTVTVAGDATIPRGDLLSRLAVTPGAPYQREDLRRRLSDVVDRLHRRGHYEATATPTAQIRDDGVTVDLTLSVEAGPLVSVKFDGDPLPRERHAELVPVEREGSVDEDLLEDSSRRIVDYLRQQGYWRAEASYDRDEAAGRLTIVFHVHKGEQYHVAPGGVRVTGNAAVPTEELRSLVKLRPGEPFVVSRLDQGAAAIRQLYQSRGFAQVLAQVNVGDPSGGLVEPSIAITEGPRTIVGAVTVEGAQAISSAELLGRVKTKPQSPYYPPEVASDRDAVLVEYLNRGYASAVVTVSPAFSADNTRADVAFHVREGIQTLVDHIIIVGNTRTRNAVIERELQFHPGEPLGLANLYESQRRLSALGLFRRVRITELSHGPVGRRDVLVTVEEALRTTIGYGGGAELNQRLRATGPNGEAEERYELAPRGFFEIGRRNIGGRNRSVNLSTRVSLRPRDAPDDPSQDGNGYGFSEYRVVGAFRQPRIFGVSGDFVATAAVEQGVRSSFNFARKGVNAQFIKPLSGLVRMSGLYSFSTTRTFDERLSLQDQVTIDRLFPRVRLSAVSGGLSRDTRDDVLEPHTGTFVTEDSELAARVIGSQVGFVKTFLQGFWYTHVRSPRVVFAAGARLGLATGFPRDAQPTDENGQPIPGPAVTVRDIPASERFFAGGETTVRGYALDTVGARNTINPQGFPIGGNALVVFNAEVRVPVWHDVGAAFFTDAGNVFARASELDLTNLLSSVGFGLRYRSPIGPIRVDLGFKLDRRLIGGRLEPRTALHFGIGEAF